MGTRLKTPRGSSLYDFWGNRVARNIEKRLKKIGSDVVVNLASTEYSSVIPSGALAARIITPVFKELRGGKAKIISFSAKRARGAMARFIIEKGLTEPSGMKRFTRDGYRFVKSESSETQWLFLRSALK
jgi:hypothetical protein